MKKWLSLLLSVLMMVTMLPATVGAGPSACSHSYSAACDEICDRCGYDRSNLPTFDEGKVTEPTIVVGGAVGQPGDTVQVTISLKNNPGIVSAKVLVGYDASALTLVKYQAGDFSASGYSWGKVSNFPFVINWCDAISGDNTAELLATLTFAINANAAEGEYPITLEYSCEDDFYNTAWETIAFTDQESYVYVSTLKEHSYVEETFVPATCTTDGVKTKVCAVCGDRHVETIVAKGAHSYSAVCDATCDVCGFDRSDLPTFDEVEVTEPTIVVGGAIGKPGDAVQVTVSLKNNPGLISAKVKVGYDAYALTLEKYEIGDLSASGYSWGPTGSPFIVNWCDAVNPDDEGELLVTLTFRITIRAKEEAYPITLEYSCEDDFYNTAWETIEFAAQESFVYVSTLEEHAYVEEITVPATCTTAGMKTCICSACGDSYTEVIPANDSHSYRDDADHDCDQCGFQRAMVGDPNGDGRVNNRDLGLLQQHLNNWSVDATYAAFDLNDDGRVNNRDLGLFQQYLNEWNVELK